MSRNPKGTLFFFQRTDQKSKSKQGEMMCHKQTDLMWTLKRHLSRIHSLLWLIRELADLCLVEEKVWEKLPSNHI